MDSALVLCTWNFGIVGSSPDGVEWQFIFIFLGRPIISLLVCYVEKATLGSFFNVADNV